MTLLSVEPQAGKAKTLAALSFAILAAVIVVLPRQPFDISDSRTALSLPSTTSKVTTLATPSPASKTPELM
jgi:hypothetical protein